MKNEMTYIIIVGIALVLVLGIIGFTFIDKGSVISNTEDGNFQSVEEIKSFLKENAGESYYGYGGIARRDISVAQESFAADSSVPSNAGATVKSAESASDYSTTNIQVEGVDEADIVKNDGKYIYAVSGKKVVIVDAFPAEEMEIAEEIEFDEYVNNIYINGDKLIVLTQEYDYIEGANCGDLLPELGIRCGGYSKQETVASIYDISDKEDIELDNKYEVSGHYIDSRMIGDYLYLITSQSIYMDYFDMPYYSVNGAETKIAASDIRHFGGYDSNYNFNLISAIDINDEDIETETYLMSYSSTVYVSEDNIYITYRKNLNQKAIFEEYVKSVLLEVMPSEEREEIKEIMNDDELSLREKQREIGEVIQDYMEDLVEDELFEFNEEIVEESQEFYKRIYEESDKTIIQKIGINGLNIEEAGSGEVPGSLLNQFSMDEKDGKLRVATTKGDNWRDNSTNNLYVLDENMEIIGEVEGLAEGERIYSARFIGDRAYMVTFRQVDPLYVIDLSDSENPEVLGYLKVTGFSSYLHPYDENHLIGVGMEADEEGRTQGVKVALFDVSDVENPKEVAKYVVEEKWSYSEASYDHKAFLFNKERNLLVIPVSYSKETGKRSSNGITYPYYEYKQGAFVFDINLNEIGLRGEIYHESEEGEQEYYYVSDYLRRSLFMDDILYTVSNQKIKASDLDSLTLIEEIELPYEQQDYVVYEQQS